MFDNKQQYKETLHGTVAIKSHLSTQDLIKDDVETDLMIHQDVRLAVDVLNRVSKKNKPPNVCKLFTLGVGIRSNRLSKHTRTFSKEAGFGWQRFLQKAKEV